MIFKIRKSSDLANAAEVDVAVGHAATFVGYRLGHFGNLPAGGVDSREECIGIGRCRRIYHSDLQAVSQRQGLRVNLTSPRL